MANESPESGTLIIAALLLLALGFSGYWIVTYVQTGTPPWNIAYMFFLGGIAIVVLGLVAVFRRGRRPS